MTAPDVEFALNPKLALAVYSALMEISHAPRSRRRALEAIPAIMLKRLPSDRKLKNAISLQ